MSLRVEPARRRFGVSVLGGPTTVVDIAGRRVVIDPTFDPPGPGIGERLLVAPHGQWIEPGGL